jgi:hypothetical protein
VPPSGFGSTGATGVQVRTPVAPTAHLLGIIRLGTAGAARLRIKNAADFAKAQPLIQQSYCTG